MHCPNCRQEIEAGTEFCGNCGARIERHPVELTCRACGSPLLPGAEFCAECGTRLGGEAVQAQSFCPECGAAVLPGDTFCVACGARLGGETISAQSVCPECGEPLSPQAAFCGNCGRILRQEAEYAPAAPEAAVTENWQTFQPQDREWLKDQQQDWSPQQGWEPVQAQQQWQESQQPQSQQQGRSAFSLPQGSGQHKMLMAAAAVVVLLVIGITGFWKPGFLLDLFRPTAKLENGVLALNDITLDFKKTNLANGKATMTTEKEKEEEVHNGLIGDLYVLKIDKSCQGKVTVATPIPKDYKPTTGNGAYIKLGVGRDYPLEDGKTARFYEYFDAEVKDGKAVAVIDPAASGRSRHNSKTPVKSVEETPDVGEFSEYVGWFYKEGIVWYGEGYQNSKGHFRLWYPYNINLKKNVFMEGGEAQLLLSDLEEAYNYYKTHGYADHVDTFTPIDVYISRCKNEGGWNALSGNMEIREGSLFGENYNLRYDGDQRTKTRATIYHETFHAVQQSIINMVASTVFQTLWFDEATSTHFERLIIPNEVSENGKKNFWLLWQGTIPKRNSAADGYARGLLIDYMSKKLGGDAWIRDCYEKWSPQCWKLKSYMRSIARTEADFAANFYMEVVKNIGPQSVGGYYTTSQFPDKSMGEDTYLSAIKLGLDDKVKEKIIKGEEDAFPVVFASPSFALEGYGGHIVSLVSNKRVGNKVENLTESFPEECQLKLEAEGGCRIQVIKFKGNDNVESSNDTIIKDFKKQINKGYKYLVLVTSTQDKKQNIVLKATLENEDLKEGIYNGKATMTRGKKSQTFNNRVGFRLSRGKDGRWGLNICSANGDNVGSAPNVPLAYDAKQKLWKGHRKFKEELSKDPKKSKAEISDINCTMKVNTEGKEPILIIDYKVDIDRPWEFHSLRDYFSFKVHFEGKWSSELKGQTIKTGKITILE